MNESKYLTPKATAEAISIISRYKRKAQIIAGGSDLIVGMKRRQILPEVIVNLAGISELNYINYDQATGLRLGALTPISAIENSSVIKNEFGILAQAAGTLGTPTIRQRATIGGNLCNAAPSADTAPALLVLEAKVKIVGREGEKVIPIDDFFTGPGETVLKPGEMLTEIQIPNMPPQSGAAYMKQIRGRGVDIAVVGVAALATMEDDVLTDVKIALGAVAPTPIRARQAEAILKGKKLKAQLLEESGQAASHESSPIDDARSSADYRRKLVTVLVKRAVGQAVEQAQSEVRQ